MRAVWPPQQAPESFKPSFEDSFATGGCLELLITGATGFVGGALLSRVVTDPTIRLRAAVRRLVSDLPAQVEQVDVNGLTPQTDWRRCLAGIDVVVHAAARVHMTRGGIMDELDEFRRVNVEGTLHLARNAAAAAVRRFIFISSIGVNGVESADKPFAVEDPPAPHSNYAISKYEAEVGLHDIAQRTGMEVVVIRPPLVIGAEAPGNFGKLIRCVYIGVPLPLHSVRNQRSFVAIDNLVDLIVLCLTHPAAGNQLFLVCDGEDLSTAELLRRLGGYLGKPARLFSAPVGLLWRGAALVGRRDIIQGLCGTLRVDNSKARQSLGWMPPITADEGIRRAAHGFLRARGA